VVERPRGGHKFLDLELWNLCLFMVKLETGWGPYVETGDRQLGRSGSGMWKAGTSNVVAPTCVGSRLMGWPP
jgi:hypothetical protein